MAKLVLFMAMSLDGFIAGPDDTVTEPAGRGGERLFAWSDHEATSKAVHAEYGATGAVLSGRRTYDLVNGWDGDHHDGVPMFILTHEPPREVPEGAGTYTFVTDGVGSAVIPVLLGEGRPLFDHLGPEHVELELVHLREAPQATHLRYRVVHPA